MQREKLLLIPGPTPVHPRITHSLSLPTVSHVSPIMVDEFKEALSHLKEIVFCDQGEPFIIAGAGTLAMEMAVLNTAQPGERVLVISQGFFGQRMAEITETFGIDCDIIQSPEGNAVLPEKLENRLADTPPYTVVASTHVDTATGACAPVKEYVDIVKKHGGLFIIDGVCSTGGIEERMTEWGVDIIFTAAQKCFGVPPGLAILVFSQEAIEKRKSMRTIPAYYADLLRWLPIMQDPSKYFSTPCVNEIRAFKEATDIMLMEGMETRFRRHSKIARSFRAALEELGFALFTHQDFLADTLSVVYYPKGIEDKSFRSTLSEKGVVVAGGLGDIAGKVFRVGHMGNLSFSQVEFAVIALEETLSELGYRFTPGCGINAAQRILEE